MVGSEQEMMDPHAAPERRKMQPQPSSVPWLADCSDDKVNRSSSWFLLDYWKRSIDNLRSVCVTMSQLQTIQALQVLQANVPVAGNLTSISISIFTIC